MEAAIRREEELNRLAAGYYVSGVVGLIVLSVLVTNIQHLSTHPKFNESSTTKAVLQTFRRATLGIPVAGWLILPHWLVIAAAYVALNVGLLSWEIEWENQAYLGSRFGWLALCNMCLVIFLGMKNTPLSPLAGRTYRDLNVLHRVCGYVTVLEVILHAALFTSGLYKIKHVSELQTGSTYAGAVAGVSMVIIAFTATYFFRHRLYEAFYALHILFVLVIIISMGFHQDDIKDKSLIVIIVSAGIWALDRAIRACRWLYYGHHGYCTLTPLAYGATRVTMTRSMKCRPGSHAFLWIPGIGPLEQHPFTLLSNDPAEFIIAARSGFTKRLYEAASKKPGLRCRAMLEGPYGRAPSVREFDRVLLISGGSGVTFAMALAREWLHTVGELNTTQTLHFVWVVRSTHQFLWFLPSIERLRAHPRVTVTLHVTSAHTEELADDVLEGEAGSPRLSQTSIVSTAIQDIEKNVTTDKELVPTLTAQESHAHLLHPFHRGRPVVDQLLKQAMAGSSPKDRTLITGSGPDQLLNDMQASAGHVIKTGGPTVQLHLEPYAW